MKRFLKAKHWQLFLLMFGVPFGFQIIMLPLLFLNKSMTMLPFLGLFPFLMILYIGTVFGWMWSISVLLQPQLPDGVTMNVKRFKILLLIPVIYILMIALTIAGGFVISNMGWSNDRPFNSIMIGLTGLIILLHLLSMFCIFHTMYFSAKTLKSVELQRKATFSDYAGEFFMLWFFPIGIWVLQPRLNKLIIEYES